VAGTVLPDPVTSTVPATLLARPPGARFGRWSEAVPDGLVITPGVGDPPVLVVLTGRFDAQQQRLQLSQQPGVGYWPEELAGQLGWDPNRVVVLAVPGAAGAPDRDGVGWYAAQLALATGSRVVATYDGIQVTSGGSVLSLDPDRVDGSDQRWDGWWLFDPPPVTTTDLGSAPSGLQVAPGPPDLALVLAAMNHPGVRSGRAVVTWASPASVLAGEPPARLAPVLSDGFAGRIVDVPGDGYCLLYATIITRPDLLVNQPWLSQRQRDWLAAVPAMRERPDAVHLLFGDGTIVEIAERLAGWLAWMVRQPQHQQLATDAIRRAIGDFGYQPTAADLAALGQALSGWDWDGFYGDAMPGLLADALQVPLVAVAPSGTGAAETREGQYADSGAAPLRLWYTGGNHYDALPGYLGPTTAAPPDTTPIVETAIETARNQVSTDRG
jgi:hypothetical protein